MLDEEHGDAVVSSPRVEQLLIKVWHSVVQKTPIDAEREALATGHGRLGDQFVSFGSYSRDFVVDSLAYRTYHEVTRKQQNHTNEFQTFIHFAIHA